MKLSNDYDYKRNNVLFVVYNIYSFSSINRKIEMYICIFLKLYYLCFFVFKFFINLVCYRVK